MAFLIQVYPVPLLSLRFLLKALNAYIMLFLIHYKYMEYNTCTTTSILWCVKKCNSFLLNFTPSRHDLLKLNIPRTQCYQLHNLFQGSLGTAKLPSGEGRMEDSRKLVLFISIYLRLE